MDCKDYNVKNSNTFIIFTFDSSYSIVLESFSVMLDGYVKIKYINFYTLLIKIIKNTYIYLINN